MTISIEMALDEKDRLMAFLYEHNWTLDEITNAFLKWVIEYPEDATEWIKRCKENSP